MTPWAWGRFACGLWMAGEDAAIAPAEWSSLRDPGSRSRRAQIGVFVGIDLGWKWDTPRCSDPQGRGRADPVHPPAILTPPHDGSSLDAKEVFGVCEAMAERWPGLTFVLDPEAGGEQLSPAHRPELDCQVLTHRKRRGRCAMPRAASRPDLAGDIEHPEPRRAQPSRPLSRREVLRRRLAVREAEGQGPADRRRRGPVDGRPRPQLHGGARRKRDNSLRGPTNHIAFAG